MADITNLSGFLSDVANAIRTKKETTEQIPAENFDQEILSIETGIDTSDATATANDIISSKTAYVNGEKITGAIPNNGELNITPSTETQSIPAGYTSGGIVRAVDNSIDENIVAENIKSGVTILGVEGTLSQAENLQEQLDAQDLIIQQLQEELAGKASGGEVKPNVFMQEDEPTTKNGIWLKGNYQVGNIVADENIFAGEEWNTTKMSSLKVIPYDFHDGSAVPIGTNIYLFGGQGGNTTAYKYDTLTDTYTQLTNIPYDLFAGSAVSVGTDVYLLGGYNSHTTAYKYDTLTDTYTPLANIPYNFYYSSAVSIGTNVYLFGSAYGSSYYKKAYKYDTLTDTYTQLTDIPYNFYYGSAVSIGTDAYLFGGNGGSTKSYKYDTLTGTYTRLTGIPYEFYNGSAVAIGTNVYLLGGTSNKTIAYKYDTLTNTYTNLTNIPYEFYFGSALFNGIDIYLFGSNGSTKTKVQVMTMIPNDYGNNSIVISQGACTKKTDIGNIGIQNAKFYYDRVYYQDENGSLLNTIPTYNGNGTEWVKISGGEG